MDEGIPVEHTDITGAEAPSIGNKAAHHHAMNPQQFFHRMRIQLRKEIVGGARVFNFEDVAPISENPLAIDDRAHRALIEFVSFDNKRGVNRLDSHLPTQRRAGRQGRLRRQHANKLSDLHAQRIDTVGAFKRRLVGHNHLLLPPQLYRHWR